MNIEILTKISATVLGAIDKYHAEGESMDDEYEYFPFVKAVLLGLHQAGKELDLSKEELKRLDKEMKLKFMEYYVESWLKDIEEYEKDWDETAERKAALKRFKEIF